MTNVSPVDRCLSKRRVVAVCPLFPAAVKALGIVVIVGLVFVVRVAVPSARLAAHAVHHGPFKATRSLSASRKSPSRTR